MPPTNNNTNTGSTCQGKLDHFKSLSTVNPQPENGHVRIENNIFESLYRIRYRSTFTLPIILLIIRKTWGWSKKIDDIALSQIMKCTGYHKNNVLEGLKEAEKRNIVVVERSFGCSNKILFNKYCDTWDTSTLQGTSTSGDTSTLQGTSTSEGTGTGTSGGTATGTSGGTHNNKVKTNKAIELLRSSTSWSRGNGFLPNSEEGLMLYKELLDELRDMEKIEDRKRYIGSLYSEVSNTDMKTSMQLVGKLLKQSSNDFEVVLEVIYKTMDSKGIKNSFAYMASLINKVKTGGKI